MQEQSERMSAVDAAWLRMDRPTNLMMIVGVVVFDEHVDFERFRATVGERFLKFPRFRCRPVPDTVSANWEPDADFDLDQHVTRIALPAPAGQAELEELVSELAGTDLDRHRPMWQFHFVENFQRGTAVILRIHHCYADGTAMVRVFLTLTDAQPEPAMESAAAPEGGKARGKSRAADDESLPWLGRLGVPGLGLVQKVYAEGAEWLAKAMDLTRNPEQANEVAKHALGVAGELARVAMLPDDPPTRFKGTLGTRKIAAWTDPLPLADVKAVAKALGCTINDLLMSTAAGALGGYLRSHGENTDGMTIRATVPVNLRDPAAAAQLGNHFGLVFLELPVGVRDPLARLFEVHAAMSALKSSYQPVLTLGLMAALGMMPGQIEAAAIDLLSAKATAVATNVPGPAQRLYLAGSPIARLIFWVPQSGDIGLGISILSYAGQVQFGLIADYKRVPDPGAVAARFHEEFDKVVLSLLMGPYLQQGG
ncbi:MAG: WS/DGAT/MGAT family O-acyltransferase [Gammaproteobacteria bacterium]